MAQKDKRSVRFSLRITDQEYQLINELAQLTDTKKTKTEVIIEALKHFKQTFHFK